MAGARSLVVQLALAQALAERYDLVHNNDDRVMASLEFRSVVRDAGQTLPGVAMVAALHWSVWTLNRQAWGEAEAAAAGGMGAMQQLVRGQLRRDTESRTGYATRGICRCGPRSPNITVATRREPLWPSRQAAPLCSWTSPSTVPGSISTRSPATGTRRRPGATTWPPGAGAICSPILNRCPRPTTLPTPRRKHATTSTLPSTRYGTSAADTRTSPRRLRWKHRQGLGPRHHCLPVRCPARRARLHCPGRRGHRGDRVAGIDDGKASPTSSAPGPRPTRSVTTIALAGGAVWSKLLSGCGGWP